MIKKKTVTFEKKFDFLSSIQYFISIFIAILFGFGLIPFQYNNIFEGILILIVIQIFLSLIRLRLLNVFLELILLLLAVISFVPFLGYVFRFIGMLFTILDMSTFKSAKIYKKVKIMTFDNFKSKKGFNYSNKNNKKSKKFDLKDIDDAEFSEK